MNRLTDDEVKHVAMLARLKLKDAIKMAKENK